MVEVKAPGRIWGFLRDALSRVPFAPDQYRDARETRIRAALLRRKLKRNVDLWHLDDQTVDLTDDEITLLWEAMFDVLFGVASDKEKRDAQRASDILFAAT